MKPFIIPDCVVLNAISSPDVHGAEEFEHHYWSNCSETLEHLCGKNSGGRIDLVAWQIAVDQEGP